MEHLLCIIIILILAIVTLKFYARMEKYICEIRMHKCAALKLSDWLSEAADKERSNFQIERHGGYGLTANYWFKKSYDVLSGNHLKTPSINDYINTL